MYYKYYIAVHTEVIGVYIRYRSLGYHDMGWPRYHLVAGIRNGLNQDILYSQPKKPVIYQFHILKFGIFQYLSHHFYFQEQHQCIYKYNVKIEILVEKKGRIYSTNSPTPSRKRRWSMRRELIFSKISSGSFQFPFFFVFNLTINNLHNKIW